METMTTRTRMLRAAGIAFVATVLATGCVTTGQSANPDFARVVIENDSPRTVVIYAIRQSSRFRVGRVAGLSREEFAIKRHMLYNATYLRLIIDPVGGQQTYATDNIVVEEGEVVSLRVSSFIR